MAAAASRKPKLLAGDNPQIAKGDGDEPVQTYIAAIPGWKQDAARRLDELVSSTVPNVRKAVKWNSPFYGSGDSGWFLSFHCTTHYIKVGFFNGAALTPMPPVASQQKTVRYLHIAKDGFNEAQFVNWVKQASLLPGTKM